MTVSTTYNPVTGGRSISGGVANPATLKYNQQDLTITRSSDGRVVDIRDRINYDEFFEILYQAMFEESTSCEGGASVWMPQGWV